MRNIFLILSIFFLVGNLAAQPIGASTYTSKLEAAEEAYDSKNYVVALEEFEKAYEDRKDKALIPRLADLYFKIRDFKKAERYYGQLFRKRRGKVPEVASEIRYMYGRTLKMMEKYDEAIPMLQSAIDNSTDETLKELAGYEKSGAEFAKIARPVPRLRIENAGNKVNSRTSEYSAYLTGEGNNEMYFSGFNTDEVIILDGDQEPDYHVKVMKSTRSDEKGWGKPVALNEKVNRPDFHTGNVTLSPDGKKMYFTRQLITGNEISESKIYYSEETGGDWGGAQEVGGVNGEWIAKHPTVGELFGKEVLFFISDMPGGQGGFDIYYATYKGSGFYGDPVNLGPKLNTAADEETPFYRDGTLYFSSTGHPGLGGYDIFNTVWNGTLWSAPKNMGLGYNSNLDDRYFMIDKEGYNGVLLSNRKGTKSTYSKTCCDDIWEFTIEKIAVDVLAGTFDLETKKPLNGTTVTLYEREGGELVPLDNQSDPSGNAYKFPLLLNKSYIVIAEKDGYKPDTTEVFSTVGLVKSEVIEQRLRLEPLPKEPEYEEVEVSIDKPLRLENIYYDFDDDKILQDAEIDLNKILGWMGEYPDMVVELSSHTDSRGRDSYNEALSQRRAESAKAWLVERGVVADRIQAVGYGEKAILNRCTNAVKCSDDEHRFNRRTEFKIISGPKSITIKKTERRLKIQEPEPEPKKVAPKKKSKKKKRRRG